MRTAFVRSGLMAALLALATGPAGATPVPPTAVEGPAGEATAPAVEATHAAPAPGAPRPMTRADLEAWLDGYLPFALDSGDIAGAVVVVVNDGEVLLQKGYGYADLETQAPVDPEATLFRPGSVSKLFTWTAVMQLVEAGQLDLDADVNQYLDFHLPEREGTPVTLRQILTHTTGMEEQIRGLIASDPARLLPLDEALKHWVPERIHVPGATPAYSNYATALAGYIVARVSGMSFDDYVEQRIFAPLGMQRASFRQPLPEALLAGMSKGYAKASDGTPQPYEFINLAPAGSLAATGADMARFMLAHLGKGALGDARILSEATADAMHGTGQASVGPLNKMMLGFYETSIDGHRAIAHGGDTRWFHSDLQLFPDDGFGVFVSFNSSGRDGITLQLRTELVEGLVRRYLSGDVPAPTPLGKDEAMAQARAIAGTYASSRRPDTNFMALSGLLGATKVIPNEDGSISISGMVEPSGAPRRFVAIGPGLWQDANGSRRLAADLENGVATRFGIEPYASIFVWERRSGATLPLVGAALAITLLTVLAWPVSALVRRYYKAPSRLQPGDAKALRLARLSALAALLAMGAALGLVIFMLSDIERLSPGMDGVVNAVRLFASVALPLAALGALWSTWRTLRGGRLWLAKLWNLGVLLACGVLLWAGITYHVVGYGAFY